MWQLYVWSCSPGCLGEGYNTIITKLDIQLCLLKSASCDKSLNGFLISDKIKVSPKDFTLSGMAGEREFYDWFFNVGACKGACKSALADWQVRCRDCLINQLWQSPATWINSNLSNTIACFYWHIFPWRSFHLFLRVHQNYHALFRFMN